MVPSLSRPGRLVLMGQLSASRIAPLSAVRRFVLAKGEPPEVMIIDTLSGELRLEGIARLDVQIRVDLRNVDQPLSFLPIF